jgi:hypothetical protein
MSDTLTVRVCGADRRPVPDRFDLRVCDWQTGRDVASVDDVSGTVHVSALAPTTMYRVDVFPTRHKPVSAHVIGGKALDLYSPIHPGRVRDVEWPTTYPLDLTRVVSESQIASLDPLARAGLLNVYAKLHESGLWAHVVSVRECCGDRIFAHVRVEMADTLRQSAHFMPVDGSLHHPPLGFDRVGSFKERGVPYGGLQVTLFFDGDVYEADIDIDDAGGMGHVFQVLEHWLTQGSTHPYDIHQLLTFHQGLDPGYRLVV